MSIKFANKVTALHVQKKGDGFLKVRIDGTQEMERGRELKDEGSLAVRREWMKDRGEIKCRPTLPQSDLGSDVKRKATDTAVL